MTLHRFVLPAALLVSPAFTQTNLIQNSGNIGIGTTAPQNPLQIFGPFTPGYMQMSLQATGSDDRTGLSFWNTAGSRVGVIHLNGDGTFVFGKDGVGAYRFFSNGDEKFRIDAAGNVGIGTSNPDHRLQLYAPSGRHGLMVETQDDGPWALRIRNLSAPNRGLEICQDNSGTSQIWNNYASGTSGLIAMRANGNIGIGTTSPNYKLEVSAGDTRNIYFDVSGSPKIGTTYGTGGSVELYNNATGAMTFTTSAASYPFVFSTGNVGIGTTNPQHKLAVNGTIKAKEVIVETTGWSDYVFADDYRLAPLSEVEAHIAEKKHLPGMPSAADVTENGVNVAQVQAALLAKVEELTLHLIAQEKSLRELKTENEALKTRMATYEQR